MVELLSMGINYRDPWFCDSVKLMAWVGQGQEKLAQEVIWQAIENCWDYGWCDIDPYDSRDVIEWAVTLHPMNVTCATGEMLLDPEWMAWALSVCPEAKADLERNAKYERECREKAGGSTAV